MCRLRKVIAVYFLCKGWQLHDITTQMVKEVFLKLKDKILKKLNIAFKKGEKI